MTKVYANPIIPAGSEVQPTVTPTLTVHATYADGDYVGTSSVPMEFEDCVLAGGAGVIIGAEIVSYTVNTAAMELWLFDTTVTPPADSAAWSISDADSKKLVAVIPFSTWYASALNSVTYGQPAGIAGRFVSATGSLFGCLVTRGAPTFATGDITVRLSIIQD